MATGDHPDLLRPSTYAHLRRSDLDDLGHAVADEERWLSIRGAILSFTEECAERIVIDQEEIFLLARNLESVISEQQKRELLINVRALPHEVRRPFSAGIRVPTRKENRGPSKVELERLLSLLKRHPDDLFARQIRNVQARLIDYASNTGVDEDLVDATISVSYQLLRRNSKGKERGAQLAQELVRNALVWRPSDTTLWYLWGLGLVREGAFDEAEDLLWNGIRRFPSDFRLRTLLCRVILRSPGRNIEALALAEENISVLGKSSWTASHIAIALSRRGGPNDIRRALSLVCEVAASTKGREFFILASIVARILVDASSTFPGTLADMLPRFPSSTFAAMVVREILKTDPSSAVASTIYRRLSVESPDNRALKNALAKALVLTGSDDDAREAESILRSNLQVDVGDRFAAGQLVSLLKKSDRPGWRQQALGILSAALEAGYHTSLEVQYASLMSDGSDSDREIAKSILNRLHSEDPGDPYVRLALARWHSLKTSEAAPDEIRRLLRPLLAADKFRDAATKIARHAGLPVDDRPSQPARGGDPEVADFVDAEDRASVEALESVPESMRRFGSWRKMRFLTEHNISQTHAPVPVDQATSWEEGVYASVLAVRMGGDALDDEIKGSFQVAVELAVRNERLDEISKLQKRFARFDAVTLLAKCILKDPVSTSVVQALLATPSAAVKPLERLMAIRLRAVRPEIFQITDHRRELLQAFYDLNEATIPERLVA